MSNISKIQEACKIPMGILGYSIVENSQDLDKYLQTLTNLPEINVWRIPKNFPNNGKFD